MGRRAVSRQLARAESGGGGSTAGLSQGRYSGRGCAVPEGALYISLSRSQHRADQPRPGPRRAGGAHPPGDLGALAEDAAGLSKIYAQIDKLERTKIEETRFTEYRQFYPWFVAIALGLVVLANLLRGTLLRRLP